MENYFNYFTEVEECYRRERRTPSLLSTLDWALVESWKEGGVPLEAVLLGIERAFEKFAKRPQRFRKINGLAYCSQTVLEAAEELRNSAHENGARARVPSAAPFDPKDVRAYLDRNTAALAAASESPALQEQAAREVKTCAEALAKVAAEPEKLADLRELENLLSALEEKLTAIVTRAAPLELLAAIRREVEREMVPYRRRMVGPQIESLGRQFLKKRLYEHFKIPRLSLFYL